ncbi:probable thiamin biosynthetic enzyme, partial [Thalassiosira pseudonana CCMP1335]
TIAGSDSGGGAGIQADLKAIHTLSNGACHGCSAITCLTAQNSCGVTSVHSPPVAFLREQLNVLEGDLYPKAVKVGMLGSGELAEEVGGWLRQLKEKHSGDGGVMPLVVVDPVMISTSGHKLVDDTAKKAMIEKVFPFADLVTPNKFEAEELLGRKLLTPSDVKEGAAEILAMGAKAVLIKGGHSLMETQRVVDEKEDGIWIRSERYETSHTHGTGCTLSSAIATAWAMGQPLSAMHLVDACCIAKAYVNDGISKGVQLGKGPGPV